MTQTRIYLPLTSAAVRALAERREVGPAPVAAFAVTDRLKSQIPGADREEWEYAALTDAVEAAGAARAGSAAKRVVAAADVDRAVVAVDDGGRATVSVSAPVSLSRVVSFHIDENAGDEGMADLLWYDATELAEVLRLL